MKKIPVWIDTDCGVDDAVALITAVSLEELEIVGVSAVAGNTILENSFRNSRDVLSMVDREDIKVYPGKDKPLIRELFTAAYVHGNDGMGGAKLEGSKAPLEEQKAWDALYEKARELKGELRVVAIGPLTNIALTIALHPDFPEFIEGLYIMGGAVVGGNITPCAEFNIYVDPEAAQTIFKSGIPVKMFGLDVTLKAYLDAKDMEEIASYGTKTAELFTESNKLMYQFKKERGEDYISEHDACPLIYLVHPELFEGHKCGIFVETQAELSVGKTCCDLYTDFKFEDRHCEAFTDINREEFVKIIKDAYRRY